MLSYCIRLGDNRRVSEKAYLNALRIAQANPDTLFSESLQSAFDCATGREIMSQHWRMIHEKWASQYPPTGKGNRARKRAQVIRDSKAECKWCGQKTGAANKHFCSTSCRQSFSF